MLGLAVHLGGDVDLVTAERFGRGHVVEVLRQVLDVRQILEDPVLAGVQRPATTVSGHTSTSFEW
jgi:hypothetical protein